MVQSAEDALNATPRPARDLYPQYGIQLRSQQIWQRLGATRDDRPERHAGPELHRGRRAGAWSASPARTTWAGSRCGRINRDSQCGSSFPETGCCPTRAAAPPQSGLQFSQTFGHAAGRAAVHPAGRGNVQPAVRRHQPRGRAVPAVVGERELPARLQGRGERRDLPGQVVQHRRRPVGAGAVRLADALGAARPGAAWRRPVSHLHAAAGQLPGLVAGHGVPERRQGASTRGCRTRPSGRTRESPRRPRRPTRRGRRGRRSTRSPASRAAHPPSASPRPRRRARRCRRRRRRRRGRQGTG